MNIETLREYVIAKPFVTEGFPFGETTIVFKVNEKIFLLVPLDTDPLQFNAKSDQEGAVDLREQYPDAVLPGFHMNKKHWNTIVSNGALSKKQLLELVDHSYQLVAKANTSKGIPKAKPGK